MNLSNIFNAFVVTIAIDPVEAERVVQHVESMPWLVASAILEGYVSDARRPYFGPEIKSAGAILAFVDFDADPAQAATSVDFMRRSYGDRLSVIAVAGAKNSELLLSAMRAGCTEFLDKPVRFDMLNVVLDRVQTSRTAVAAVGREPGQVLCFCGVKGGVGTTTLAVHLAIHLARKNQKKVLLIDAHEALGHVCVYLGLEGEGHHFQEMVRNVGRLDTELMRGIVASHAFGVDVLSSPDRRGLSSPLEPESIVRTIEFLRTEYDFVLVDCDPPTTPEVMAVVQSASAVYLVATPDVGAVRDLARYNEGLSDSSAGADRVQVVLNRSGSRYAIEPEHIEKAIRRKIDIRLPNSFADLIRSGNRGEPILPGQEKSEFNTQFDHWTTALTGAAAPEPATAAKKKDRQRFALFRKPASNAA
jgi:pilus assembly protein CpaE